MRSMINLFRCHVLKRHMFGKPIDFPRISDTSRVKTCKLCGAERQVKRRQRARVRLSVSVSDKDYVGFARGDVKELK